MRRAARRDANESDIVAAARQCGLKVFYTNELGDLVVQYGEITEIWECKTDGGKLTPTQCRMRQAGLKARTVRSVDDVLAAKRTILENLKAITDARRDSAIPGATKID